MKLTELIVLYFCRFASFNKSADCDRSQDPWALEATFSSQEGVGKDEKFAPIAKLESLDELDLVSFKKSSSTTTPPDSQQ